MAVFEDVRAPASLHAWAGRLPGRPKKHALERAFVRAGTALAALALVTGTSVTLEAGPQQQSDPDTGPVNVLLVTIDTLRADRLGSYGYSRARTPAIDALAASGARFERAYALQPVTLPSHTTLLTGTHPAHHGIEDNGLFLVPGEARTLGEILNEAGLATGAIVSSFVLHRQFGLDQGFETYDDRLALDRAGHGAGFDEMPATAVSERALAWIDQHADEPWFLWVHYYDPHAEYDPPPEHRDGVEHPYDGEVAYVDFELARILEDLDRRRLDERTLVIVTSDHGESLGEHGEPTHGLFLYEAVMRIPLIVRLPGTIPAGRVVSETTSLMDVAPTVLAVLGIPVEEGIQGQSLVPLLVPGSSGWEESPVVLETRVPWHSYGWSPSSAIVHDGAKFIDAPQPELYDLDRDPKELDNLVDENPGRAEAMERLLKDARARLADGALDRPEAATLDEATRERLASLGYLFDGTSSTSDVEGAPDVKDMVDVLHRISEASRLRDAGHEDEAIALLEAVLERSPDSRRVLNRLGTWYARRKDFRNAERHFQHLLEVDPNFIEGYENFGLLYANAGRLDEATELAETALSKSPRSAKAYGLLGIIRLFAKDYRGALEPLTRAIEYYPTYHEALSNRGVAYFYLGELEAALADVEAARRIAPDHPGYARFADQIKRRLASR